MLYEKASGTACQVETTHQYETAFRSLFIQHLTEEEDEELRRDNAGCDEGVDATSEESPEVLSLQR
jgi:hypothetical protein